MTDSKKRHSGSEGRILVPFFVPSVDESVGESSDEDLRVNETLAVYDSDVRGYGNEDLEEGKVSVRTWDKQEGYFIEGERKKAEYGSGKRRSTRPKGGRSSPRPRRSGERERKNTSPQSSPATVMAASRMPTRTRTNSPSRVHTPPTNNYRFAGSSFESASPSPLVLPVPSFTRRMAEAAESEKERKILFPTAGEQLQSMSLDLRRLLKI